MVEEVEEEKEKKVDGNEKGKGKEGEERRQVPNNRIKNTQFVFYYRPVRIL